MTNMKSFSQSIGIVFLGNPWFDNPASVGIFGVEDTLLTGLATNGQILMAYVGDDTLSPQLIDPCLIIPSDVCVHTSTYRDTVFLPFRTGGYQLAYQRCCRNATIQNIVSPLETGATYSVNISELALTTCNSNAKFNNWPPIFICAGKPIYFDHSASDLEGDSIVYSLCTPLTGANQTFPQPQPPNPPPYQEVIWMPPYNLNNVLGGIPLEIDPHTGIMTGTPNTVGQFVVGVCTEEYRNGELISINRRDFQYNIRSCSVVTSAFFAPEVQCDDLTVQFDNQSSAASSFLWDFGDPGTTNDISIQANPTYTYPDTGTYQIRLIAKSSETCQDTFYAEISLQYNGQDPKFEVIREECSDTLLISVIDGSIDTVSQIQSWEWILDFGTESFTSKEPSPEFSIYGVDNAHLTLHIISENGCESYISEEFFTQLILDPITNDSFEICAGDSVFINPDPIQTYSYLWSPSSSMISDSMVANPLVAPLESIEYSVTVENTAGCETVDHVWVQVNEGVVDLEAIANPSEIYLGETSDLSTIFLSNVEYLWSPSNSLDNSNIFNPIAKPLETTTYEVQITNESGCIQYAEVEVRVIQIACEHPYVFVPNAFSPNADGQNDILYVKSNIVDIMTFRIFNRWGEKVFETNSFDQGMGWNLIMENSFLLMFLPISSLGSA